MCVCLVCVWLFTIPWTEATRLLCLWGFSRQEYWSGLPFPSPGDLPNPGMNQVSHFQADSWPSESPGKPYRAMKACYLKCYGDTREQCFCFLKSAFHIFHFSCLMVLGIQVTNHVTSFSFWLASLGFPGGSDSKESAQGLIPESERLLKKGEGTHSSILAWRIPWTKEPGGLQSTGSQRVRHDWETDLIWSDAFFV